MPLGTQMPVILGDKIQNNSVKVIVRRIGSTYSQLTLAASKQPQSPRPPKKMLGVVVHIFTPSTQAKAGVPL